MVTIEYEGDKAKVYSDAGRGDTFAEVLARRISRRNLLKSSVAASAIVLVGPESADAAHPESADAAREASPVPGAAGSTLNFEPISQDTSDQIKVAPGHRATPFLRWGDPITADAPDFDPTNQTPEAQAKQFGYNCDWIGFLPLPMGSNATDRGLLIVNHEYTNPELMFPGYLAANPEFAAAMVSPQADQRQVDIPEFIANPTQNIVDVELEAHGLSTVEIARGQDGTWSLVRDSQLNRRITATTPMDLSGPAAGAPLLMTGTDPTGTQAVGTLNNCAGGVTPWGTALTGEENFQQYFANLNAIAEDNPIRAMHDRFGVNEEASERLWENFYDRFDLAKEPNEPFHFGWAVEIDPYDPQSKPKKRTALGRAKHEGATSAIAPGGQVVIYTGDDERFEYAYKFVTAGAYNPDDRAANMELLDEGTLYAARFNDDGTGEWLALVQGENGLTGDAGFPTQADVLINTRLAADAAGATKMDRPEDFETNPITGKVYLVCTNNSRRNFDETSKANPRPNNIHGHIIEITEDGNDHASTSFTWEMFLLAGDPAHGSTWFAGFDPDEVSPISSPDNITFDLDGNIWISTDGQPNTFEVNDGLFAAPTQGAERGHLMQFFSAVPGAEVSGPVFTPDNNALFASVQHPGEGGTYEEPISTWPDGATPVRPSVVMIQAADATARVGVVR